MLSFEVNKDVCINSAIFPKGTALYLEDKDEDEVCILTRLFLFSAIPFMVNEDYH